MDVATGRGVLVVNTSKTLASRIEVWVWVLIYAGLISVGLGLPVRRQNDSLGLSILVVGSALMASGIVLIVWRSRMRIDDTGSVQERSRQ